VCLQQLAKEGLKPGGMESLLIDLDKNPCHEQRKREILEELGRGDLISSPHEPRITPWTPMLCVPPPRARGLRINKRPDIRAMFHDRSSPSDRPLHWSAAALLASERHNCRWGPVAVSMAGKCHAAMSHCDLIKNSQMSCFLILIPIEPSI
jgi:hypothetical protein